MWELKVIFHVTEWIFIYLNTKVPWHGLFKRNNNIPNQGKIFRPSNTAIIIYWLRGAKSFVSSNDVKISTFRILNEFQRPLNSENDVFDKYINAKRSVLIQKRGIHRVSFTVKGTGQEILTKPADVTANSWSMWNRRET